MANEQTSLSTIFDIYGNMLSAQYAFVRRMVGANMKIFTMWTKSPEEAALEDERPSISAKK